MSARPRRDELFSGGDRALELFCDRYPLIRCFAEYLNTDPPQNRILYFHGDGGNGKSLLLKFLHTYCCKRFRPQTWQQLKTKTDAEVAQYIEEDALEWEFTPVPAILHDFGQSSISYDRQPQNSFYGLLMLQQKLVECGFRFPVYSYACVWYWYRTGKLEKAKELLPSAELDALSTLIDTLSKTSWASLIKAGVNLFEQYIARRWGQKLTLFLQQRGLRREEIENIQRMDAERELVYELPRLLVADFNAAMAKTDAPERVVLFFDTHEAFWGERRDSGKATFFRADEWLRYLLTELNFSAGIVVVVAGREPPCWAEAPLSKYRISPKKLELQPVGHLAATDAHYYLRRVGIRNDSLTEAIIAYASVAPNEVQPFLLGLCADVVEQARAQGQFLTAADFPAEAAEQEKLQELTDKLLQYADAEVEYAVYALCAARVFDQALYFHLGQALNFSATVTSFQILVRYSFVWKREQGYRLHELLRRHAQEDENEITRCAHAELERYYREQGNRAEAIYHAICQNWEQGVEEWLEVFDAAVGFSRWEECQTLLEICKELSF